VLDTVTGLSGQGTLTVTIAASTPPQVTSSTVAGTAGSALAFVMQVSADDSDGVTFCLSGAPSGMSVNTAGVFSWPSPVAGAYTVTVIATDSVTGLTGQGTATLSIAPPTPPTITPSAINGVAGYALSYQVNASAPDALSYALTSGPAGMSISSAGQITWNAPVAGTYSVLVTVEDTVTQLTAQATYSVTVLPPGPAIAASSLAGSAGTALSSSIAFSDAGSATLTITVSGIPDGMSFAVKGNLLEQSWAAPIAGSYSLQVSATDTNQHTKTLSVPVTVSAQ
jgi:hypothetical protein